MENIRRVVLSGRINFTHLFILRKQRREASPVANKGLWWAYPPQTKLQAPQIEIWHTVNQWRFCQFLECQAPCTNAKPPYWKLSSDGSERSRFFSSCAPPNWRSICKRRLGRAEWQLAKRRLPSTLNGHMLEASTSTHAANKRTSKSAVVSEISNEFHNTLHLQLHTANPNFTVAYFLHDFNPCMVSLDLQTYGQRCCVVKFSPKEKTPACMGTFCEMSRGPGIFFPEV